jgi:hypothetical protein
VVFCRIDITLSYRLIDYRVSLYFISPVILIVSHNLFIMLTHIIITYFDKVRKRSFTFLYLFIAFTITSYSQNIDLQNANISVNNVTKYQKVEWTIQLTSPTLVNTYDYDEINIKATLVSPSGKIKEIDGFFMQDFNLNETNGTLTIINQGVFKIRFSPDEIGTWNYTIRVDSKYGSDQLAPASFTCTDSDEKGFIRVSPSNYLHYDDGCQYIPIGYNIAWHNNNPVLNYTTWLSKLSAVGGNFYRLWMPHWGLSMEWRNGNGYSGLRKYKETNMAYLDWLVEYSEEKNMGIMLCIQHHGQVSTTVNPNWSESPYNVANGGPCATTADFFTNQIAKNHTKNRLKYILARWGYSTSIMSWELFNEVNWTDNAVAIETSVASWHAEMASFIKENDVYNHLVTTSTASEDYGKEIWNNPDIDFTQSHIYINNENIERAIISSSKQRLKEFEKPTLMGEFGLGDNANLSNIDADGVHIHNTIWASLFSGAMGTAMSWWWDNYIEPNDLYFHFKPIAASVAKIDFLKRDLQVGDATVQNAPGDLTFSTSLGWGEKATDAIISVKVGNTYSNVQPLSTFLYGSQWNTQFRSLPTFEIDHPQASQLVITTGSGTGNMPIMAVYVDNILVLNKAATVNTKYSVNIPSGKHLVKIDNIGTDWINVSSFAFVGLGSAIDIYTLKSPAKDFASGWVFNNKYVHTSLNLPDAISDAKVMATDFTDGLYDVVWYDCLEFDTITSAQVKVTNGILAFDIPSLPWDAVFTATINNGPTATKDVVSITYKAYPNPVHAGGQIQLTTKEQIDQNSLVTLFDNMGKMIDQSQITFTNGSANLPIPLGLNTALYWIHIKTNNQATTIPIIIQK